MRTRGTTVRTGADTGRLASAVSRPGIDPRVWIANAKVLELGYDPENGLYADVQVQPAGDVETCLIGSEYTGANFGMSWPVAVGDVVLIAYPMGDPNNGPVIIKRLWSAILTPPSELADPSDAMEPNPNPVLRLQDGVTWEIYGEKGSNIQIKLTGGGKFTLTSDSGTIAIDSPDVKLGGGANTLVPTPWATALAKVLSALNTAVDTFAGSCSASADPVLIAAAATLASTCSGAIETALGALPPDATSRVKAT